MITDELKQDIQPIIDMVKNIVRKDLEMSTTKAEIDAIMNEIINELSLPTTFAFDSEYMKQAEREVSKGNRNKAKDILIIGLHKEYGNSLLA